MSSDINDIASEIVNSLEKVIDARFQYLVELTYENHRLARNILEETYLPERKKLQDHIKKVLTTR